MDSKLKSSELVIHPDGSIFHLKIKPGQLAPWVILVGDPGRVDLGAELLDSIDWEVSNREFRSASGSYQGTGITFLSTGIGTDNMDIVMNELDALVNVDFETRQIKREHQALNLIRVGTSGVLQPDIPVGSWLASKLAVGLDGLLPYYAGYDKLPGASFSLDLVRVTNWPDGLPLPYSVKADPALCQLPDSQVYWGNTVSAHGFYAPQGRILRAKPSVSDLVQRLQSFQSGNDRITNFEMETSALYGLSALLGHRALTICLILANRATHEFLSPYQTEMRKMMMYVLNQIVTHSDD